MGEPSHAGDRWRCAVCGATSTLPVDQASTRLRGVRKRRACPWCAEHEPRRQALRVDQTLCVLAILLVGSTLFARPPEGFAPETFAIVPWTAAMLVVQLIGQQVVRSLLAVAAGLRVVAVRFGWGDERRAATIGGVRVGVLEGPMWTGAVTVGTGSGDALTRGQALALAAAGPLLHTALGVAAFFPDGLVTSWRLGLVIASGVLLYRAAQPLDTVRGLLGDLAILSGLRGEGADDWLRYLRESNQAMEAAAAMQRGDWRRTNEIAEDWLAQEPREPSRIRFAADVAGASGDLARAAELLDANAPDEEFPDPADDAARHALARGALDLGRDRTYRRFMALLDEDRLDEAAALMRDTLSREPLAVVRPLWQASLAQVVLWAEPTPRELTEAYRLARTAFEAAPWDPEVILARTLAQAWSGEDGPACVSLRELRRRAGVRVNAYHAAAWVVVNALADRVDEAREIRKGLRETALVPVVERTLDCLVAAAADGAPDSVPAAPAAG